MPLRSSHQISRPPRHWTGWAALLVCCAACTRSALQTPALNASPRFTPLPPTVTPTANWRLVWADEFDSADGSAVDAAKWSFDLGAGGWGNGELQCYTDRIDNAYIQHGALVIRAQEEDYQDSHYTSARLVTRGKGDWLYGRVEVRAKLPYGQGIWPAIWMLPTDWEYGVWPRSGEIDIMEMVGHEPAIVYGTLHYGIPHTQMGDSYDLPGEEGFADDHHIFMIEWEPGEIRWYVDGYHYQTQTEWFTSSTKGSPHAPFDEPFHLILNVAVGGAWPGFPDETTVFPQHMAVDYVRVYQK